MADKIRLFVITVYLVLGLMFIVSFAANTNKYQAKKTYIESVLNKKGGAR